jgi:hypothetical protein
VSDFQTNDLAQIRLTLGDRNKDGTHDATVEVYGKIPFTKATEPGRLLGLGPYNVPTQGLLAAAETAAAALPPPASAIVRALAVVLRIVLP